MWQRRCWRTAGWRALRQFDDELIAHHLSPGGSAVCWR
ncbi:triphosphoribosyl-dephospho-CoA synthase [Klebsiella pneumoniae]|nr:triphosphoribosyl-dephospho-CoA synthase [Klebsiella pneumoniae]